MHKFKVLNHLKLHPFVGKNILITTIFLLVASLLLFLPWQQTVKGIGTVTALNPIERNYKIVATIDGFIDSIYVKENQFVKKGDKLFSMKDLDNTYEQKLSNILEEYQKSLKNTKESYLNVKNNLKQQKNSIQMGIEVYDTKLVQLQNRLKALHQQEKALTNQYNIEKRNYQRAERLFANGIESQRNLELKKFSMLKTKANVKKITIDIENIYNDIQIIKKEKISFKNESELKLNNIQNKLLNLQSNMNRLQQSIDKSSITISRYSSKEIVAKNDGYVMRIYQTNKNRFVKKGEEIMYFSPKVNQRAILLKIPTFNMPLIKKGLKVRIIFYGWPSLQISGWPKISHGTYGGVINSIEQTSHEKGFYYAVVVEDKNDEPWPSEENLRIGTEASIWVRLQIVPIWYELWRLIAAQPPKMVNLLSEETP